MNLLRGSKAIKIVMKTMGRECNIYWMKRLTNPDSYTSNYKNVYETLIKHSSSLSPHQAYAMTFFLGMDSSKGYKAIPRKADFQNSRRCNSRI